MTGNFWGPQMIGNIWGLQIFGNFQGLQITGDFQVLQNNFKSLQMFEEKIVSIFFAPFSPFFSDT